MKNLSNIDLDKVTGGAGGAGFVSPCIRLDNMTLGQLREEGKSGAQRDLAQAAVSCGVPLPTKADVRRAKNIRF